MRLIGSLPHEAAARRFVDYLLTRHIAAHADESSNGSWQIWVEDDDHLDAGRAELTAFAAAPADPKFDAADRAEALRKEEAKAVERRQRNYRDVRTTMFAAPNAAVPVTMIIIGLCVALFVITHFAAPRTQDLDVAMNSLSMKAERALLFDDWGTKKDDGRWAMFESVRQGEVWRMITPALLHGGLMHIVFNMMWMLDLGRRIEPLKGSGKFLLLVLASALLSNLAQATWMGIRNDYAPFLGMSGVVSALFGYAWMCGKYRPYECIFVSQYETGMMLGWLVICSFGIVGPIANAAHWGGLVVGVVLGAWPTWWRKIRRAA